MRRQVDIDEAVRDRNLLGAALGDNTSWFKWTIILRAAFGLPINDAQRAMFVEVAGARTPPNKRVAEMWVIAGRRSGKTRVAAAVSVYIAAIEQHKLAPGEVGCVLLLAASRSQASVAYQYVLGFLQSSPILRQQIESATSEEVRLKGNIVIGVHAGSYRTIRGRTLLAVVGDETSYWRDEDSAQPDIEIFRACAPALAASCGLWVGISTGYRKLGLLYQKWRDYYGQSSDDILVVQAASEVLNPTLDVGMIERAKAADPEAAEAEWSGGFRNDIGSFLDDQTIEQAIEYGRPLELPPRSGVSYRCFVDPSGGRNDAYTIAIAHRDGERIVIDALRGKNSPLGETSFDPQATTEEFAELAKQYRCYSVTGDNFSAEWCQSAWCKFGVRYDRSEVSKSAIYMECLPLFTRGLVSLPDHPRLLRELRLLERHTHRSGKDTVDHGRNGHDDYANAACGVLYTLSRAGDDMETFIRAWGEPGDLERWRRSQLRARLAPHGQPL